MACRRSLEYVTALATIAMALALIAFAISVTNLNRNNRERKENNDATNGTTTTTATYDRNGKQIEENENDSETQLLIGTTTKSDLVIKPTELSAAEKLDTTTTAAILSSSSTTEENIHIVLPTIKPVLNPVTSNNILPVDDDVDDAVVVIDNNYGVLSTTTITSAIDPSTIEVTYEKCAEKKFILLVTDVQKYEFINLKLIQKTLKLIEKMRTNLCLRS